MQEHLVSLFKVAGVLCAIPLAATIEVIPRPARLAPTPFGTGAIAGTVQLRGNVIPVLDLAAAFGSSADDGKSRIIMVVNEQDRLLGVLVEELCGMYQADERQLIALDFKSPAGGGLLFTGTFQFGEEIAYLLDVKAVCSLGGVPTVARKRDSTINANRQNREPILFFRVGSLMLAVQATEIETTVPCVPVSEGPLTSRLCHGTMEHLGHILPVADLAVVLGFAQVCKPRSKTSAIVLRFPAGGRVALAVDDVHDIGASGAVETDGIPAVGPLDGRLFQGLVTDKNNRQHLLLRAEGLLGHTDLMTLSRISHPLAKSAKAQHSSSAVFTGKAEGELHDFLFFKAGRKFASPLQQISQIIPLPQEAIHFNDLDGGLQGVVCHRSKSLPLIDLVASLSLEEVAHGGRSYVLIVETGTAAVGLVVEQLYTVERSRLQLLQPNVAAGINRNSQLPPGRMVNMNLDGVDELVEYLDILEAVAFLMPERKEAAA